MTARVSVSAAEGRCFAGEEADEAPQSTMLQQTTEELTMMTSSSIVTGVDFVAVATTNLAAAREFYGDVLGLPCSSVWREADPLGAEFETGSLTLALLHSQALGIEFRPNNHPIALHVDDVEAARAALESRGVSFTAETVDTGVCHMAYFADPDGNALMLHHRYAPRGVHA
jgi:catechol 2,3-dioxygenase-like lactoylglutathione lyase family enzyme